MSLNSDQFSVPPIYPESLKGRFHIEILQKVKAETRCYLALQEGILSCHMKVQMYLNTGQRINKELP